MGLTGAVIVPTYRRPHLLAVCLASLASLSPAPEFVIVVDGSPDPPPLPARLPSHFHRVAEPNQGPSHARNTGLDALAELSDRDVDVVCFIDDDAVARPCWFGDHLAAHQRLPQAGAVGGGVVNLTPGSVVADYSHWVLTRLPDRSAGPVRTVPSLNVSYKQACLDEVGGFDEDLFTHEDVELCRRIALAGWTVQYEPSIEVGHHYRTSWRALVAQQRSHGRGFAQSRRRWPDMPGADFFDHSWPQLVGGTATHLAREAWRTGQSYGWRLAPASIVRELTFRSAAMAERYRLEHPNRSFEIDHGRTVVDPKRTEGNQ